MTDHMDPSKYFVVSIREYDEMKAEIERLREQVEDCENDFEILSQIFDKVRAERDRMRGNHD